jgi:transcriptional regulator with XRE-family HTH domain
MATLAETITGLRGSRTYVEFAVFTGVNRQTLRDVEMGAPIRLDTLRQIAKACDVSGDAWVELLILWIRSAVGEEEFQKLDVRAAAQGSDMRSRLLEMFGSVSHTHQSLIMKALAVPQIMDCVASVTNLFDGGNSPGLLQRMVTGVGNLLPSSQPAAKKRAARKSSRRKPAKKIYKK